MKPRITEVIIADRTPVNGKSHRNEAARLSLGRKFSGSLIGAEKIQTELPEDKLRTLESIFSLISGIFKTGLADEIKHKVSRIVEAAPDKPKTLANLLKVYTALKVIHEAVNKGVSISQFSSLSTIAHLIKREMEDFSFPRILTKFIGIDIEEHDFPNLSIAASVCLAHLKSSAPQPSQKS